jgi:hypothetical protein
MRSPVRFLFLAGILPALAATQLAAQEAVEPVTLAFKYKTGQAQKFASEVKTEATLELGGGGGLGPIPFTMNMKYGYSEKVVGTRQGTGTLSALLEAPSVAVNAVGQDFTFKKKGTKTIVTQNGQPVDPDAISGPASSMMSILKSYKAVLRRSPAGELTPVSGSTAELGSLLNGGYIGPSLRLPDKPVAPGDTWEYTGKIQISIPGPVPSLSGPQDLELKTTYTLKAIETKGVKQFALIEAEGAAEGNTPQGTAAVSQKGTTRFDIARGAVVSGKYSMTLNVAGAAGPAGGNAAPNAPPVAGGTRLDAVVDAVMRETPVAAAAAKARGKRR